VHVLPRFGEMRLAAITQREVRAWVAELADSGLEPASVHKAYQVLSKLLRAAVDAELLAATPCRRVSLPKIERQEMRFLDPVEVTELAGVIDQRYRALVLVGAYGGLRPGELAGLRCRRVDLEHAAVEVAEIVVEVEGKLEIGPPKTRASRRWVSLPDAVVEELAKHLANAQQDPNAWVFPAPRGGPLRATAFRNRVWHPATAKAGLSGLRVHDLRHTAVALWIAAGANPKQVSVRAGHTSVAFALDRYGHLFPDADTQLRKQLDRFARGEPDGPTTAPHAQQTARAPKAVVLRAL
jgi:integrase